MNNERKDDVCSLHCQAKRKTQQFCPLTEPDSGFTDKPKLAWLTAPWGWAMDFQLRSIHRVPRQQLPPYSQEKMLPPHISPSEQFGKSNSGYKTNLQIKYSRGQVTGFVLQYIIWRLKMASFPSGETKNVRRQANPGREGMHCGEKQPPHPT